MNGGDRWTEIVFTPIVRLKKGEERLFTDGWTSWREVDKFTFYHFAGWVGAYGQTYLYGSQAPLISMQLKASP